MLLIALGALVLLAGCNGDSSALTPTVEVSYEPGAASGAKLLYSPPDVKLGDTVGIVLKATAASGDVITDYSWTQTPIGAGTLSSTTAPKVYWQYDAVNNVPPGAGGQVPVTLSVTIRTAKGGKLVLPIYLNVKN